MNNDLISRSKLIKAFNEAQVEFDEYYKGLGKAKVITDNAPTVEAYPFEQVQELVKLNQQFAQEIETLKRPQGKWGKWVISEIQCPICLEYFQADCYSTEELNECPSCGADMRGDENEQ